ncbi:MAG: conjugative transposon protein TraK [Weeksellaceae bacterium]|nr:conjugative transposon protein TraK [Acholeplasmataceae bacterium]
MLIKDIRSKIKINKIVTISAMIISFCTNIAVLIYSNSIVQDSRKSIYIIDNGVPILAKQTDETLNRPVEYRGQVQLFHSLFFTLPPDDRYIKSNVEKSLYLIDDSGKKEYSNLREKGFYNQLISSNSILSIQTDSIKINTEDQSFIYYGKQLINRINSLTIRNIETSGNFIDMPRTINNPHGVLLTNWRIIDNSEISKRTRNAF